MTVISSRAGHSVHDGQFSEVSGIRFARASFGLYVPRDITIDSLMRVGPHAIILPNGVPKTTATVTFSANVKNSGNGSGAFFVLVDVFIGGVFFKGGTGGLSSAVSATKTVAPGASTTTGVLSIGLSQSDPAGAITAKAFLVESPSMFVLQTLSSPGLGTIESTASFTIDILGGGWTVS